ncbi:hypothetical protein [Companilactobacillus keshanensis]|uniref:Transcriptional regulator n=1 Tax=Companilactobacillus keshanensis TaxID=2486003 RepID=A0ABW4BVR0_9LACO|nr:hypothetical protein [Companilactobacillus keshanensis]
MKKKNSEPYSDRRWRGDSDELNHLSVIKKGNPTKEQELDHDKFVAGVRKIINDKRKKNK